MLIGKDTMRLLQENRFKEDPAGASSTEEAPCPLPAESGPFSLINRRFSIAIYYQTMNKVLINKEE